MRNCFVMTNFDWLPIVGQVPITVLFVWFTLELLKRQSANDARRDHEWRDFLSQQRERNNEAISRIAEEVKLLAQQIAAMNALLITHDARVVDAIRKLAP